MEELDKNFNPLIEDCNNITNFNKFKRRENNILSSIERPKIDNLNKLIIPYDFELKKYDIKENEIAFYEKKEYLLSKLNQWNKLDLFKLDESYNPSCWQNSKLFILYLIVVLLYLIISIIAIFLFIFNPVLIFILFIGYIKINQYLQMIRYICIDKFKLSKINKIILNENSSNFCIENKLIWTYGESGYWLELSKNL